MIRVFQNQDEMPAELKFMFDKLFGADWVNHARIFVVANTLSQLQYIAGCMDYERFEIRFNQEHFGWHDAPEFYGILPW
jgi:hypothetical protein